MSFAYRVRWLGRRRADILCPAMHWESEAENWLRWARAPSHDAYWWWSPSFFAAMVPDPGERTLEVGSGEGRVARDLARLGHRVVACDIAPTLVDAARALGAASFLVADAARLPFPDASFDLVVAYNSLMDMDQMATAVGEAARVLERGGRFCISVTHPVNDAGRFSSDDAEASFVISGSYFERRPFVETVTRDGLEMTFRGWAVPLEGYARALENGGFVIERLREPRPAGVLEEHYRPWERVPMFLHVRAQKR